MKIPGGGSSGLVALQTREHEIRYARAVRFPRGQLKRFSSPRSSRLTFARCKTITDPPETAANAITGQGSCRTTAAVGKATAATRDATDAYLVSTKTTIH